MKFFKVDCCKLKEYFNNISVYQTNDFIEKTKESNTISLLFNHYL